MNFPTYGISMAGMYLYPSIKRRHDQQVPRKRKKKNEKEEKLVAFSFLSVSIVLEAKE